MSWGATEEALPAGGDAGSTIDDVLNAWWVRIRKFIAVVLTDTSDTAIGSGADEDNPKIKDDCVTTAAIADDAVTADKIGANEADSTAVNMGVGLVDNSDAIDVDGIVEQGTGTHELKVKVLDIGDWNMDGTSAVAIAHGLGAAYKKIRTISVVIRDDNDANYYLLNTVNATAGTLLGGCTTFNVTTVNIARVASAGFDAALFNATTFNRGWITIWYEV